MLSRINKIIDSCSLILLIFSLYLIKKEQKDMEEYKYYIRYKDLYALTSEFRTNIPSFIEKVESMENRINIFIENDKFSGKGPESIKTYFKERHLSMLKAIKETAQALLDTSAWYKDMYFNLEPTTNFLLPQEGMDEYKSKMETKLSDAQDLFQDIKDALSEVEELFTDYTYPNGVEFGIEYNHGQIKTEIDTYEENIEYIESETVTTVEEGIDVIISIISAINAGIGIEYTEPEKYQAGDFEKNELVKLMNMGSEALSQNHAQNEAYYTQVWEREEELEELARQRKVQGAKKIALGVGITIVGVACVVVSAGAASPIVIAAGVAVGTATAITGEYIMLEGGSDIYLGEQGDLNTRPVNPVKNALYNVTGSDDIYYLAETTLVCVSLSFIGGEVFKVVATLITPLGLTAGAFGISIPTGTTLGVITVGPEVITLTNLALPTAVGVKKSMDYYEETGDGYGGIVRGGARTFTTAVVLPGAEQVFAYALGGGVYVQADEKIEKVEKQTTETITMVEAGKESSAVEGGINSIKVSKATIKHIQSLHNPNKVAQQLLYNGNEVREISTYFNKDWSEAQIEEAVIFGYNEALNQGINTGEYTFIYNSDTVTVCLKNGILKTGYGNYKYSLEDLLRLIGEK